MKLKIYLCSLWLCFGLVTVNAQAQGDNNLANNLIQLRGEVEDLQSELKILKSEHTNTMSYLNTRKTELQANVDRKNLKIKQTNTEMQKLQEKINEKNKSKIDFLLKGSFLKVQERIKFNIQLIDNNTNTCLLSAKFEEDYNDIFDLINNV